MRLLLILPLAMTIAGCSALDNIHFWGNRAGKYTSPDGKEYIMDIPSDAVMTVEAEGATVTLDNRGQPGPIAKGIETGIALGIADRIND